MNNRIEEIENEEPTTYAFISYKDAVEYMHNSLILCNNILEIDEYLFENCELCNPEEEFFQYFLTDCSKDDAESLHEWFGLNFLYSEKLDLYVLAVDHFGTPWNSVSCGVYNKEVAEIVKRHGMEFKD